MNWLKRFMYGRYGGDILSRELLIFSFVFLVIVGFLPKSLSALEIIAYIPTAICIFRIFSKNIYKRQQENYKYLKIRNRIATWLTQKLNRIKGLRTHKYFTCSNCKQKLRVPRGQGKISITCPKCRRVFKGKS